jgi:hypothetical protein
VFMASRFVEGTINKGMEWIGRDEDEMHAELNHAPHRSLFLSGVEWSVIGSCLHFAARGCLRRNRLYHRFIPSLRLRVFLHSKCSSVLLCSTPIL